MDIEQFTFMSTSGTVMAGVKPAAFIFSSISRADPPSPQCTNAYTAHR